MTEFKISGFLLLMSCEPQPIMPTTSYLLRFDLEGQTTGPPESLQLKLPVSPFIRHTVPFVIKKTAEIEESFWES